MNARPVLLLALAGLLFPTLARAETYAAVACNPKISSTNVRSGPSTKETQVIDKIANNTKLTVLERVKNPEGTHDWLKVSFPHSQTGQVTIGYIYHEGVSTTCPLPESAAAAPVSPPTAAAVPSPVRSTAAEKKSDGATTPIDPVGRLANASMFDLSPSGRLLLTMGEHLTAIYDVETLKMFRVYQTDLDIEKIAFLPDERRVAIALRPPVGVAVYDIIENKFIIGGKMPEESFGKYIQTMLPDCSGERLFLTGHKGSLISWKFGETQEKADVFAEGFTVGYTQSKACEFAAINAYDGRLFFRTAAREWRKARGGHDGPIIAGAFSPDGKVFATTGRDGMLRLWDPATGLMTGETRAHDQYAGHLLFVPNSPLIATASGDMSIRLWNYAAGLRREAIINTGHESIGGIHALAVSPDGKYLASGASDDIVILWQVEGGRKLATFGGPASAVTKLAFTPDGTRLIGSDMVGNLGVWMIRAQQKGKAAPTAEPERIASAPDTEAAKAARRAVEHKAEIDRMAETARQEAVARREDALAGGDCETVEELDRQLEDDRKAEACRYDRFKTVAVTAVSPLEIRMGSERAPTKVTAYCQVAYRECADFIQRELPLLKSRIDSGAVGVSIRFVIDGIEGDNLGLASLMLLTKVPVGRRVDAYLRLSELFDAYRKKDPMHPGVDPVKEILEPIARPNDIDDAALRAILSDRRLLSSVQSELHRFSADRLAAASRSDNPSNAGAILLVIDGKAHAWLPETLRKP